MSVEHRPLETSRRAPTFDTSVEPVEVVEMQTTESARNAPNLALAAKIERTKLQTKIAALERELAASERELAASECRRQAIVGQYELALEERTCDCDRTSRSSTRLTALLRRLR